MSSICKARTACGYFAVLLLPCFLCAQGNPWQQIPFDEGVVQHNGNSATVSVRCDRWPLLYAVLAVSNEYGWTIDYEDPPYKTDESYLSQIKASGGYFRSEFPEPSKIASSDVEERVLNKIISDYNRSGNPGIFTLQKEAEGRFAVIGVNVKDNQGRPTHIPSILDTPVSFPKRTGNAYSIIELILKDVSAKEGVQVDYPRCYQGQEPAITLSADDVPARMLLLHILRDLGADGQWALLYFPSLRKYSLNLLWGYKRVPGGVCG